MYDRSIIEKRYTQTLFFDVDGSNGVVQQQINVPFVSDELIIKRITYATDDATEAQAQYLLQSDLPIATNYLCSFTVESTGTNIIVPMWQQPVNSLITFRLYSFVGGVPVIINNLTGSLSLTIEFVKYALAE